MNINQIAWLQDWYASQCDGDWEHSYGIQIGTLDNPGWSLLVNLDETELQNKDFSRLEVSRSEDDWLRCWVGEGKLFNQHSDTVFQAICGRRNLIEVLEVFRFWAEQG